MMWEDWGEGEWEDGVRVGWKKWRGWRWECAVEGVNKIWWGGWEKVETVEKEEGRRGGEGKRV